MVVRKHQEKLFSRLRIVNVKSHKQYMFTGFSMANPKGMAEFAGFTGKDVEELCHVYKMDFEEI